ncbi:TetR-like C-terminal domain-containing protein [Nonomuraea roseoviolacea]|uniref:TetR-like C-terminal domain-containing protein n=1 Tax=Nonomuraea roseoviolacea TaxID=103837 RepID=UPI003B5A20FB
MRQGYSTASPPLVAEARHDPATAASFHQRYLDSRRERKRDLLARAIDTGEITSRLAPRRRDRRPRRPDRPSGPAGAKHPRRPGEHPRGGPTRTPLHLSAPAAGRPVAPALGAKTA